MQSKMRKVTILCIFACCILGVKPNGIGRARDAPDIASMHLPQIEEPPSEVWNKLKIHQPQNEESSVETDPDVDSLFESVNEAVEGEVTYVGAVLEYEPYNLYSEAEQGAGVLRVNALNFAGYAAEAKNQGADIMVTPEYGLQSLDMFSNDTEKMITFCQYVPNPSEKIAPLDMNVTASNNIEAMSILSQAANDQQMYLSINMAEMEACSAETVPNSPFLSTVDDNCPESGYFFYNTQTVFDRTGTVIARYRKQNLYLEPQFTQGPLNDSQAIFQTDFDVVFTLQVCFDIVWEHPGYSNVLTLGIRDVSMGTAWVDELPYTLADSVFNGWSRGLNANLLVAGHHRPPKSKLGSGIFRNYKGDEAVYTYDKESGNMLLVANVTTVSMASLLSQPNSKLKQVLEGTAEFDQFSLANPQEDEFLSLEFPEELEGERIVHTMLHTNLENFTSVVLPPTGAGVSDSLTLCDEGLCCNLTYEYSGDLTYMFLVHSGAMWVGFGTYRVGVQICSVVWCKNEDVGSCAMVELGLPEVDSFGPFTMKGVFESTGMMVTPGGLYRNLTLIPNADLQFNTNVETSESTVTATGPIENALTLALFGRWYSNV